MGFLTVLLIILVIYLLVKVRDQRSDLDEFQEKVSKHVESLTDQLKAASRDRADLRVMMRNTLEKLGLSTELSEGDMTGPGQEPLEKPMGPTETHDRVGSTRVPPATKVLPSKEIPPASPVPPLPAKNVPTPGLAAGRKTVSPIASPPLSPPQTPSPKTPTAPGPGQALGDVLASYMGPLSHLWGYGAKVYHHYKERDKLPVFFLTVMGIITLSVGFGFILQYSFANILNETAKILIGFGAAIGIIIVGMRLIGSHKDYRDYGSGLIGLGIILNYICIYFVSTYYGIVSPGIGFFLIFVNTLIAVVLALKFETRVVAVVTLLGGAFTPFYLNTGNTSPYFYMGYLGLLCGASVFVSRRIDWKTLATLSFLLGWGLIEFSIAFIPRPSNGPVISLMLHLFAYLYLFQSLVGHRGFRESLGKDDILLLAGSLALFLYSHFDLLGGTVPAGVIYLINAAPFLYAGLTSRFQTTQKMRVVLLTISMTLVGFAIPSLLSKYLMGFFWGQEAIFMVLLGFLFKLPVIRQEGYAILLVAAGQIIYTLPEIWGFWSQTLWTGGFLNLWILPVLTGMTGALISRYDTDAEPFEHQIRRFAAESLPFLITTIYLVIVFYCLPAYLYYLASLPAFLLLFWGYHRGLPFTRGVGFALYGVVAVQLIFTVSVMIQTWPPVSLGGRGYLNLVLLGGLFFALLRFLGAISSDDTESVLSYPLTELLSLWAVGLFYTTLFYLLPDSALIFSPLPMFALAYWGCRKSLPLTHLLGYGCYGLILVQIFLSTQATGSLYFTDQTITGKGAMIEAFLLLGLLQFFYERWVKTGEEQTRKFARGARTLFYLLCPLVLLSPVRRHLPNMLPLALWASAAIGYGMLHYLKLNALRYEFYALVAIAVFWGSAAYGMALDPGLFSPEGAALLAGIILLVLVLLHRKGHTEEGSRNLEYRHVFRLMYYYLGWCILLFVASSGRWGILYAFSLAGLYFMVLASLGSRIPALDADTSFIRRLAQALVILTLLKLHTAHLAYLPMGIGLPVFALLIGISLLYYRFVSVRIDFYGIPEIDESGRFQHSRSWIFDVHLVHMMALFIYGIGLHYLTGQWLGPHLTVALVFHAIFLLFQTIRPRFLMLNRLSILLFILAGVKLFFHDLADFSLIQKVFVFVIIGSAMLIAAYFFQRVKIKLSSP